MSSIHWVSYLSNSLLIYDFWFFFALLWLFALILHCLRYFNRSLYTDVVLFFFSFFLKTLVSSRAKRACENERGARERKINFLFSSSPTPTPFRWRSINPLRFIFYNARSTDFEEKIEGLWTGYFNRQKYKIKGGPWPSSGFEYIRVLTHV